MSDAEPLRRPAPSFRDWCLAQAKKWQNEADSRDRGEAVNFCCNQRNRYLVALQKAREGFQCRPA